MRPDRITKKLNGKRGLLSLAPPETRSQINFIIRNTFRSKSKKLPTRNEILSVPAFFTSKLPPSLPLGKNLASLFLRDSYVEYSFPILNHEFLSSLKKLCKDLKFSEIAELNSGPGYLSDWLNKYGVLVKYTIDNKSWKFTEYLGCVTKYDSIQFVKEHNEIQLYILSWPYMDEVAFKIWKAMKSRQYLLYIGENGGATADKAFFNAIEGYEVEDKWNLTESFMSFFGIHDRSTLFQK